MKVTIVRPDGFVSIDGVAYSGLDMASVDQSIHALQWSGEAGEVEFVNDEQGHKPANVFIDSLDDFQGAIAVWQVKDNEKNAPPTPPTEEELVSSCEQEAKQLLADTDWSQLPDVSTTLQNKSAFDEYRAAVRVYALAPVANPVWPDRPTAVWAA